VTPETIFYGGSTTKAFTAAALSLRVDNDTAYPHVKWTSSVKSIIADDFVLADEYSTSHATLEDAASHRTSLPRHDFAFQGGNQTSRDIVRALRFLPLTQPICTTFQYCNLMYLMLGHVIETLTGQ
jgi:CubicO group peptidase (beta-lactamase class C family)